MSLPRSHLAAAIRIAPVVAAAVILGLLALGPRAAASSDGGDLRQEMLQIAAQMDRLKPRIAVDPHAAARFALLQDSYEALRAKLGGDDPANEGRPPASGESRVSIRRSDSEWGPGGGIAGEEGGPPFPPGCEGFSSNSGGMTNLGGLTIPIIHNVVTSTINVSGVDTYLFDVNVTTSITHSFAADLDITLTSPVGTVVTLTTDNGGGNDDVFNGTLWNDDANPDGPVPYTSNNGLATDHVYLNGTVATTLAPEEALAAFIGENPNGNWTLTIVDDSNGDGGQLASWSLDVTTLAAAPTVTGPTTFNNMTAAAIPSGPVTVTSAITVSGANTVLFDLDVTTFITHQANEDLDITLTSPNGTDVTLTTDNGGVFDNAFNGTVWNDDANPGGPVPYASNNGLATDHAYVNLTTATPLAPEEALGAFIGENPNGTWTLTISDDATFASGNLASWSLSLSTLASAPAGTTTSFSNTTPVAIPAADPLNMVTSSINVSGFQTWLWDVNVRTFLTHTANGDLDITVRSPAGTSVTLTTDNGGSNDNVFNGTLWDDQANPVGQVPYTGNNGVATDHVYLNNTVVTSMVPEEALGAFMGENPNGTWLLTIVDDVASSDGGELTSWQLQFTTLPAPPSSDTTDFTNSTPLLIPTKIQHASSNLDVAGIEGAICDVNLRTFIAHTFASDLDVTLRSPNGTIVTLTTDNGGTFDNVFNGTVWDDDADPAGALPHATNDGVASDHNYQDNILASPLVPEEAMAAFNGEDPNGTWTITISDDSGGDGGSMSSWTLSITDCQCGGGNDCPADINDDNVVDVNDLLILVGAWGSVGGPADINEDNIVDVNDLLILVGAWGACP